MLHGRQINSNRHARSGTNTMSRRIVGVTFSSAVAIAAAAGAAMAQSFPTRPLTMVVPFAAGGTSDVIARTMAEGMRGALGQPVIVENIGGAGGMTGSNRVARAPPDGYQLVLGNVGTHAQNQSLYRRPLYNAATGFAPVVLVAEQPFVLVARNGLPAGDLAAFISYAKANQASMHYGSAGVGGSNHLACLLFNAAAGIDVTHVPYRSGAQAMADLIAERLDYQCPTATVAVPQVLGGSVKGIAILTRNRSPMLPMLPSAHEQGLTDFDATGWYALFLPAGTPAAIVRKLHDAAVAAMTAPALQDQMKEIGADTVTPERRSSAYLQKLVEREIERWKGPIQASGVQAN
jgi:tripartite-type tricarboxylate transporter receptor subunit TctC